MIQSNVFDNIDQFIEYNTHQDENQRYNCISFHYRKLDHDYRNLITISFKKSSKSLKIGYFLSKRGPKKGILIPHYYS